MPLVLRLRYMTRTTLALLLVLALTGCRLLEETRHAAANALAAAVVRSMFELQSSVPAGPSSRPLDRPAARLAMSCPAAAAASVGVTTPAMVTKAIAAAEPSPIPRPARHSLSICLKRATKIHPLNPDLQHVIRLCKTRVIIRLDENGNVSM